MGKKRHERPKPSDATDPIGDSVLEEEEAAGGAARPVDAPSEPDTAGSEEEHLDLGEAPGAVAEEEIRRLQEELSEANDRLLRLAAEFDNYKKRMARDHAAARERAQGEVVRQLLEALDDLGRVAGLEESDATVHDVVMGVHMVEQKLQQELEALGTERVAFEGEAFDPNYHEAIGALPVPEDKEPGTIASVVQRGYRLGDRLLRAARVLVYVDPEPEAADGSAEEA